MVSSCRAWRMVVRLVAKLLGQGALGRQGLARREPGEHVGQMALDHVVLGVLPAQLVLGAGGRGGGADLGRPHVLPPGQPSGWWLSEPCSMLEM